MNHGLCSLRLFVCRSPALSHRSLSVSTRSLQKMDYTQFFSENSRARKPSAIRALLPLMSQPGMISLGGGLPNPEAFPFSGFTATLKNGEKIELTSEQVNTSLQYSATQGVPELVVKIKDLQRRYHAPQHSAQDWDIHITNGSQDALTKAFEMLLNPGDNLLVENPTYSGALAFLGPLGVKLNALETDGNGLIPSSLEKALSEWNEKEKGTKPKVLYLIPVGQNPSGASLTEERKDRILEIAQKHNIIILEDDPYFFLHFGDENIRSIYSRDKDGRVLRFDSFSKILSSGIRLGFVTGPKPLVDRIQLHTQATTLHANGLSQVFTARLLDKWGPSGFDEHIAGVKSLYRKKRDLFCGLLSKHLTGLATWDAPTAGMFVWIKITKSSDTLALIQKKAVEKKVLLLPGQVFSPSDSPSPYVRASFSIATPEQMDEALRRFAEVLKESDSA